MPTLEDSALHNLLSPSLDNDRILGLMESHADAEAALDMLLPSYGSKRCAWGARCLPSKSISSFFIPSKRCKCRVDEAEFS